MNQQDSFMQQMIERMDKNNREKRMLVAERARTEACLNAYRYGYFGQHFVPNVKPESNGYMFCNPIVQNAWNSYWLCLEQKRRDEQERKHRIAILGKVATESVGIVLRASKYKKASAIYDTLSIATADNTLDAVTKATLAVNTLISMNDGAKTSINQEQEYDVSCHETDHE